MHALERRIFSFEVVRRGSSSFPGKLNGGGGRLMWLGTELFSIFQRPPVYFYCCCGVYTTPLGHKLSPFETERERLELLWEIMGPDLEIGKKGQTVKRLAKLHFLLITIVLLLSNKRIREKSLLRLRCCLLKA